MAEQEKGGSTFLAFMMGAAIGGGLAILFAPRSGEETREKIRQTAEDFRSRVQTMVDEAETRIRETVEEGKAVYQDKKASLRAAAEAGREAYRESKDTAMAEETARAAFEPEGPTSGQA